MLLQSAEEAWLDEWESDEEAGRQELNGSYPLYICRVRKLPDKFPVTDQHLAGLLQPGKTLQVDSTSPQNTGHIRKNFPQIILEIPYQVELKVLQDELEAGRFYLIDLEILTDVETGMFEEKQLELAVPLALYYLKHNGKLSLVALQLGQHPGRHCPIWTPNDTIKDWTLAKFWFKNAQVQVSVLYNASLRIL